MSLVDDLTVMILTWNEASNIARTLDAVAWAKRILIVDSGSSDETLAIVARYPQAEVVTRPFDSFAKQCNFGLSQIQTTWVLSMDADYVVTAGVLPELKTLNPAPTVVGFVASFVYVVHGKVLRASLYPPRCVLYRVKGAEYQDEGHGHRIRLNGELRPLGAKIYHDDRKPLVTWMQSQLRYAEKEAAYLRSAPRDRLSRADHLRLNGHIMPWLVPLYTLFWKRCLFMGPSGWYYTLQRAFAELAIALELADRAEIEKKPLQVAEGAEAR